MGRGGVRWLLAVALLGVLPGCSRAPGGSLTGTPASTTVAGPTSAPTPSPSPTRDPAARLPAVLAEIPLGLPEGDTYQPGAVAFDGDGRAVALCYSYGQPHGPLSGLVTVDLLRATRGKPLALPAQSVGPLAAAAGRAYVCYQDKEFHPHLLAVDLQTGRTLADMRTSEQFFGDSLAADPSGRLYALGAERLEVRDGATLQLIQELAYATAPGERTLALDAARGRLYLGVGERVRAYRASDLQLLWEAASTVGPIKYLTLDRAGRRVYARGELYQEGLAASRLQAVAADTGEPLDAPQPPGGTGWLLALADSEAGYLIYVEPAQSTRVWQAGLDGRPNGVAATLPGYCPRIYADGAGHLAAPLPDSHLVMALAPADLQVVSQVVTGIEIRNLVADPGHDRVYLDDAAGRVHAVDTRTNRLLATVPAGSGQLVLDVPNNLLFVTREPMGRQVAVVDTSALTVTAIITGGDSVAVDSAGHRAFVGWGNSGLDSPLGEVAVYDTRTFQRTGAIPHRGAPAYNPVRDEVYLRDYSAYVVDGKTLALTGELTPDVGAQEMKWCNGCLMVGSITVDPQQDVIAVGMTALSAGKGPGAMPQPRLFSAATRLPVTHTVTVLDDWGWPAPLILPADGGRVYESQRYSRYIGLYAAVVYAPGSTEPLDYRDGLKLDYYLPGAQTALSLLWSDIVVYDARTWQPLGRIPYQPIRALDPVGRRLYAWEGSTLAILGFEGARPRPPDPPEPWPAGQPFGSVRQIELSPALARDRTLFVVTGKQILRSTDGGATWALLKGGLPYSPDSWGTTSYHLAASPAYGDDHTLFAGGMVGDAVGLGVWRSTDGGDTWQPSWQGLQHLKVDRLAVSPQYAQDRTALAYCRYDLFWRGQSGTLLFRTTDGGDSWSLVASLGYTGTEQLPAPKDLLPYPAEAIQFRHGDSSNELLRSADGGRTWQSVLRRAEPYLELVAVLRSPDLNSDRQVFALYADLLYRSQDGGLTWQSAGDRDLVRPDATRYFSAMALGAREGGGLVLFLGDYGGHVLSVDPAQLHWGAPPGPAATATPPPVACPPADPPFQARYLDRWQAALGCPSHPVAEAATAFQRFEHGMMFWRADWRAIYVLSSDSQGTHWAVYTDSWQEGQPESDPSLQPPAGLRQPVRGFGKLWRETLGGPQAGVGWASEGEQGYSGRWQDFQQGLMLIAPDGRIYALFADGHYESE